jgi:hypothetical protein
MADRNSRTWEEWSIIMAERNSWVLYQRTLNLLYKRMMKVKGIEPAKSWCKINTHKVNAPNYCCLICGALFPVDYSSNRPFTFYIEEHGISHLKEKNLLPFT